MTEADDTDRGRPTADPSAKAGATGAVEARDPGPTVETWFAALAAMDIAVVLYDAEDRIRLVSPLYRAMFPEETPVLTPGTPYVETLRYFAAANDRVRQLGHASIEDYLAAELKRHRTPYMHQIYRRSDGRWVEARKIPLPDGGIAGLWRDVTIRQTAERQLAEAKERAERADAAKSAFLALMSHELRTPLNAIIGFAEILASEHGAPDDASRRDFAGQIVDGGRDLLRAINDILDLTKLGSGGLRPQRRRIALPDLLDEMARLARMAGTDKGLLVETELEVALPELDADAAMLRRMLRHLIENAVAASPAGGRIRISAAAHPPRSAAGGRPPAELAITVEDDGPGLSAEQIARVMQPFAQAPARHPAAPSGVVSGTGEAPDVDLRTRPGRGLGLGLPLVKAMAELHDGRFALLSESGGRTRARLVLPAASGLPRGAPGTR